MIDHEWTPGTRAAYDKAIAELEWARGVMGRYEMRMQEMQNELDTFRAAEVLRAQGRSPTFAEMLAHRHIATERYHD